ncbi:MAG: hypothetical protein WC467_02390 [Patescibacteria group bacterium]
MKISNLLNELAKSYVNLNKTLSMCYLADSYEMFVENMIVGENLYSGRMLFEACYEANENKVNLIDAQKELLISNGEILCVQLGDIYFVPGQSDSILFSKDLELLKKSYWAIKGVDYKLVQPGSEPIVSGMTKKAIPGHVDDGGADFSSPFQFGRRLKRDV